MGRFSNRDRRALAPQSAFWKQQGWVLSAAFFAVVVVAAAFGWLVAADEDQLPSEQVAVRGPLSANAPRGADGRPEGCRTEDSDTAVPTAAPTDVEWRPVGLIKVPVSSTAGPVRTDGPLHWCFAHTPQGAALAAQVIVAQMSTKDWRTAAEQQLVESRARTFYVALHSDDAAPTGDPVPSFAGFVVARYSPEAAVVRLLLNTGGSAATNVLTSSFATTAVTLRWAGGDWKVLPTSSGTVSSSWEAASDNNGFVLWKV
jgi:hypothetical protein